MPGTASNGATATHEHPPFAAVVSFLSVVVGGLAVVDASVGAGVSFFVVADVVVILVVDVGALVVSAVKVAD